MQALIKNELGCEAPTNIFVCLFALSWMVGDMKKQLAMGTDLWREINVPQRDARVHRTS